MKTVGLKFNLWNYHENCGTNRYGTEDTQLYILRFWQEIIFPIEKVQNT